MDTRVDFDKDIHDEQVLTCPRCGGNNLHHGDVTVFERTREDGPATVVSVGHRSNNGNPSDRRDGVVIRFTCENACDPFELTVTQHKGWTLLAWREI